MQACADLGYLPGHCCTITGIVCDSVEAFGDDGALQLRVSCVCTGGVAFVWAPTAEDEGETCQGGIYLLDTRRATAVSSLLAQV